MTRYERSEGHYGDVEEIARSIEEVIDEKFDYFACPAIQRCRKRINQRETCTEYIVDWLNEEVPK